GRRAPRGQAGSCFRGAGGVRGGALHPMRLLLPAPARTRRPPGRLLSGSLPTAPGAVSAPPVQGLVRTRAGGPLGPRLRARLLDVARGRGPTPHPAAGPPAPPPALLGLPGVARARPLPRRGLRLGRRSRGGRRARLAGGGRRGDRKSVG